MYFVRIRYNFLNLAALNLQRISKVISSLRLLRTFSLRAYEPDMFHVVNDQAKYKTSKHIYQKSTKLCYYKSTKQKPADSP